MYPCSLYVQLLTKVIQIITLSKVSTQATLDELELEHSGDYFKSNLDHSSTHRLMGMNSCLNKALTLLLENHHRFKLQHISQIGRGFCGLCHSVIAKSFVLADHKDSPGL